MASRNNITRALVVLFCSVATFSYSQGLQRYPSRVYSTDLGLSQSSVYHILKSQQDYIWVGTGDGLNRLTPTSVQVFRRDFSSKTGLYDNAIRGIIEESNGNIWIGTDKGLNVYAFDEGKIKRTFKNSVLPTGLLVPAGIYNGQIVGMQQNYGIFCLDPATGKTSRQYPIKELFYTDAHFFLVHQNFLWTTTLDNRLLKLNLRDGTEDYVPIPDRFNIRKFSQIGPLIFNEIYIAADSSLYGLNIENGNWRKIVTCEGAILTFGLVNTDEIWVSIRGKGLCRLNLSGELLEPIVAQLSLVGRETIDLRTISTISQTDDGLVWLGVEGTGAVSIYPKSKFQWISKDDPYIPGLSNSFCRSISVLNSNEILLGTYLSGLFHIDLSESKVTEMTFPEVVGKDITAVLSWQKDTVFVSSETGVWMLTTLEAFNYRNAKKILNHSASNLTRAGNNLILPTTNGLYALFDNINDSVQLIKHGNFVYTFPFQDQLWATSTSGITVFDSHLKEITEGGNQFAEYGIKTVFVSEENGLWVSTRNGLLNIDSKTFKILKQYTIKEGLPNNNVYGVLSDGSRLWGSTNRGLFSLDILTDNIVTYTQADGVRINEFNSGCFTNISGDRMIFGGVNGLSIFTPRNISDHLQNARVVLKEAWINDKETDLSYFNKPLKSTERNLIFEWDALEWTQPEKIRLACMLTGQDNGWITLDGQNSIRYTALPPGDFKLYIRASNQNGSQKNEQFLLAFSIAPPFYSTWWFITASVLVFASLFGVWIYKKAANKYQKKLTILERKNEMDNLRKRISRDIHDDVGSDLSKMRMILQQARRLGQLVPYLSKLQELSEKALTGLSEVVWTVNSDYDRLPQMAAWFRASAYDFFESEDIQVRFESPEILPQYLIDPDLRRNILMIYKEGLNNIVKHSEASQVDIRVDCSAEGLFTLEWFDNGKGFSCEKQSCGNGLQNMRRRAEASDMEYAIISIPTKGTRISIKVRLLQKYN